MCHMICQFTKAGILTPSQSNTHIKYTITTHYFIRISSGCKNNKMGPTNFVEKNSKIPFQRGTKMEIHIKFDIELRTVK